MGSALRIMGHEVALAFTAAEALGQLESFTPEVALLDVALPDMNGRELGARLRQHDAAGDQADRRHRLRSALRLGGEPARRLRRPPGQARRRQRAGRRPRLLNVGARASRAERLDSATPMELRLANVTKRYGAGAAVDGIDLTFAAGRTTVLIGPPAAASRRCCAS